MAVLEAMASGLPVLVTDHSGFDDVVTQGQEGFVVPIRRPDALAEHLAFLRDHRDVRAAMGSAARTLALGLSWSQYGDSLEKAYRVIVGASGKP